MPTNKFYKKPKKEDSAGVRIPDAVPAHNQNPTNSKGYRYANPSNSHTYGSAGAKVRGDYNPEQRIQNSYGLDRQRAHEMDARRVRDQFVLMDLYTRANRAQRQAEEEARNRQAQSRSFNDTMNLLDYYSQRPSYSYATPGGTVSVPLSNEKPMQGDQLAEALRAKQAQDYMQSEIDRRYRQQRAGADLRAEKEAKRNGVILNPEDEVAPSYNALTDDRFMRDLSNRADFERNSQYKAGSTFTGDLINNVGDTRQLMENATTMAQGMNQSGSSVLPYPYVQDYMDENEKNTYNYLLNTYGQDKAEEYFKQIEPELNRKWSEAYNQNVENFSTQNPVMGAIASALSVPGKGIYDTAQMIQMLAGAGMSKATGEPLDINNPYMTMTNTFGTMRNAVNEQVTEEGGEWAGWAYGTAMSIADNLYQLGMAGGFGANTEAAKKQSENLVLGLMGTGAAAASIRENIESGMDQDRAVALGIGSGLIEVITEKIGMDNLFNTAWTEGKGSFTQMIKMLAKQAASEGAEEGLSDIMNWSADYLYDVITAKDEASWYRDFADQKAQHPELTDNEIWGLVYNNMAKELGMDILGGAVSGFAMGGGMTALGVNNARGEINRNAEALTSDDVQDVIEGARESESKKANAMADVLQEKLDSGQEITDKEVQDTYKASAMADYVNEMTKEGYLEERTGQQEQQERQNDMERLGLNENEIEDYYKVRNAAAIDTAEELAAFDKDFLDNYRAGQGNISTNLIKAKEGASTVMSPQLRMTANNLGRMYNIRNNNGQYLDMDKIRADEIHEVFKAYSSPGFIETKASTLLNISKETRDMMDSMGKAYGAKVVFVESITDEKGKSVANGTYRDGVILIALDSAFGKGQLGKEWTQEKAYRLTFGHELAHRLAVTSPDTFRALRDAIIEFRGEATTKANVSYQMDLNKEASHSISEAAAMEEVVADFLSYEAFEEGIFERFIAENIESSSGRKTLARLRNGFRNLLDKIRGVKGIDEEKAKTEKIIKLIDKALKEGAANVKKTEKVEMSNAELQARLQKMGVNSEVADVMVKGGYEMPDNGAYSVRTEILWDQALKTLAEGHENTQEYRNAVQLVHSMTKQVLNDEEMLNFVPTGLPGGNPLRSNIEYIVTFDMDALCPRTYEFGAYRDAVEKRLGRKMNEKEARALIENLRAYGMMIPCTYCYVESKRMALNTAYNKYFELYDQIAGAKTDKQAYAFVPENAYNHKTNTWKNNTKGWQDRFAGWRALKNNKYSTSPEEMYRKVSQAEAAVYNWLDSEYDKPENFILSADGFKDFKLPQKSKAQAAMFDHFGIEMKEKAKRGAQVQLEGMFEQWLYDMQMGVPHNVNPEFNDSTEVDAEALDFHHEALKYAKSSSQAHGVDNYAPYSDQILKLTTAQKAVINARGGIRKHSSNDFRLDNLVDYVQFYTHLALDKRGGFGWFGHTYTKDTLFAELFAPTNDRINMSIAMFGDGGRLGEIRPNLAEGADWNEVKRLRNNYDNLGAMAMVTNNAQLSYALNSDWIDMIIPFHASGMTKELYNDVMAWYDYTSVQSDKLYTNKQLKEMGVNPAKVTRVYEYYKGEKDGWVRAKKPRQVHFLPGDQYIGTKGEEYLEHLNDENYKGDLKAEYDELVKSGNIIPGHENSSEKYLELCKQYGVKPRFSGIMVQDSSGKSIDITEHPNYVKVLKETARTDTQQKEITMEGFDLDYAMSQLKARSAHGGYNTVKGNEAIVNDFVENVINKKKPVGYVTAKALATKFASNTSALSEIIDENGEYLTEGMTVDELREFELNHPTETKSLGSASVRLSAKDDEFSDADTRFSIRTEDPPKKTGIAYKVFLAKDGKLYPPMVANPGGEATPVGVWLNADVAPMAGLSKTGRPQVQAGGKGTNTGKSTLAFRPGWHLGDVPLAKQFARVNPETGLKELFPANFVWAECEYAMDVDYQHEADEMGYMRTNSDGSSYKSDKYQHSLAGLKKIPKNGYYHYRTNPNPDTVPWVITGAMKVNRILNDSEVNEILRQKGIKPMKRQGGPIDLQALGFQNESRYSAKEDSLGRTLSPGQIEYFKDSKVRDENGNLKVMYHGTGSLGFTVFDSEYSDDGRSLFFTDRLTTAKSYSGNHDIYLPEKLDIKTANERLEELDRQITETEDGFEFGWIGEEAEETFATWREAEQYLHENWNEIYAQSNEIEDNNSGNYEVYLNLENPLVVNADGHNWDDLSYDEMQADHWNDDDSWFEDTHPIRWRGTTTRDIAEWAQENGYDGVIFNNLVDTGLYASRNEYVRSMVAIAFASDQIKATNNLNPTEDPDIRYSVKRDSEGNRLSENQEKFFRNSKVRDEDGNLLVVYHGTDADFTVFDRTKGRSTMDIQGSFFSPWEIDAGGYGENVKAYYLNITNPAPEDVAYRALNLYKGQNNAGIKAREFLEKRGYDGVNNGNEEYIAFDSNQIKLTSNLNPTKDKDIRYALKDDVDGIIDSLLAGKKIRGDIQLTDSSPSIVSLQKGAHNYPLVMKSSHMLENILTEEEAKKLGLKVDKHTHYHGIGKTRFLEIIKDLDGTDLAYRGTPRAEDPSRRENYFLLISKYSDDDQNRYNVPIQINTKGQVNEVFIDANQIATVFGRSAFDKYIEYQLRKGNLVRVTKKASNPVNGTALIAGGYRNDTSFDNTVPQPSTENKGSNPKTSLKTEMDSYELGERLQAMEKENARLAKMVESYKLQNRRSDADHVARAQGKIPVMDTITEKAAKDLAKDIVKAYNAAVPTGDLSKQIQKASLLMVREAARPAAMRGTSQAVVDDALWKVACDMAEKILDNSRGIPNAELTGYREQFDHYETVNLLAGDILERMMKAEKVKPTKADKNAMKLQETRRAANKRLQDAIKRERTNKEKAIADLKAHNKEVQQNKRARHEASVERTRLLRVADRLKKLKTTKANRALIEQTIRDVIGGDLATVYKTMTGERLEKLQALKAWYEGKTTEGSPTYDPDFVRDARIEAEIRELEQLHVNDLNLEQVTMLNDVLRYLENEIRTNKKTINTSDQRLAADQGFQIIKDTRAAEGINHLEALQKSIITEVLRPETLVKRIIGYDYNSPLWQRYQDLEDGQLEMVRYQMQANRMFDKFISDKKFWKMMTGKNAEELTLRGIDTETNEPVSLKITPAMRMSIYLHSLNEDNMRHMSKGGLTVPDISAYKKGNLQKAYDKATTVRISQSYARSLYDQMSAAEKAYLETVQRYFNEVSTPAINEVSNLLKGYDIAEVENYFPINTDQAFSRTAFGEMKHDGSIEGMGWTKERVQNARNPILLVEVEDVVNRAVKDHSKYIGLAIPIRNFNKVMGINQASFDSEGNFKGVATSVQREIAKKWNSFTMDYLNNLFDDLQNPKGLRDNNGAWFQKLQSKYAGGVLELNAGVAIKQAASLPTAAAVLGYGPILRAMANVGRLDEANYYKYSPLGEYRERGYASQELGDIKEQGIKLPKGLNWIQAMDSMTVRKLFKASEYYVRENYPNLTVGSEAYWKKVGEVHTDVITQTQPNYTTLQRPQILRSQNTLVKALNMFKTQPFQNFNILFEAAGEFRATGNRLKMADTAENRAAHKAAGRKLARAISSQLLSSLVFALMQAAWDLFRKKDKKYRDEDEELTFGSFLGGIGLNMLTNAGGMLPWMNTILEWGMSLTDALTKELTGEQIFGGQRFYGMEVGVLSNLTDTADALKNAVVKTVKYFNDNENVTGYDAVGEMIDATADVLTTLGLPAKNFRNDIYAAYNWIYQGITGEETNVDSSTIFDTETRTKNSNAKKMASGIEDDPIYTRYLAEREKHPDYKKAEYNVSKSATKLEFDKDDSYEKYSGIMSKDEYILYNLALQTADMQNDANGSYKQTERAQALDMLDFLTKQEKNQIWTDVLGYKTNNPYN